MRRRPAASILAQPLLIGAVTVLITIVAVFLAYNANEGLPFVPITQLEFESPNGAALTKGNEVREGGERVGFVDQLVPVRRRDGQVVANITIKLDASAGEIPRDSTVAIRPRSLTGLKYVELDRGTGRRNFIDGDTIPVSQARVPVQLDDLQGMYDAPTRRGVQDVLTGAGNTFALRGVAINEALGDLPRLLRDLEPVARTLGDPETRLGRFVTSLERTVRTIAPVADEYANSFSSGADALEAWSRNEESLEESIRQSPRTLAVGIPSLRVQRPFLENTRRFSVALRGAAAVMPANLPRISAALDRGIPVQRETPELYRELKPALVALEDLMTDGRTTAALRGVTDTVQILRPLTRYLGPHVTVCNAFNYAFTNASEAGMERALGRAQRTLVNFPALSEVEGEPPPPPALVDGTLFSLNQAEPTNGLHLNVLPAAIDEQGNADCEAGQRGYLKRRAAYAPADRQIVIDPNIPGNQGPTYTGRARVPEGQTFTRRPEVGPVLPPEMRP